MSDPNKHHELIIVRRHEDEEHEAHSSAWKVAHADFMTAMMAFFLIMWLINVTDEDMRKAIANYFNPVQLSESVTDRKGLNSPEDLLPNGPAPEGPQKSTLSETPGAEGAEGLLPGGQPTEGQAADAAASAAREKAAFQDPYAILDKLAAEAE